MKPQSGGVSTPVHNYVFVSAYDCTIMIRNTAMNRSHNVHSYPPDKETKQTSR